MKAIEGRAFYCIVVFHMILWILHHFMTNLKQLSPSMQPYKTKISWKMSTIIILLKYNIRNLIWRSVPRLGIWHLHHLFTVNSIFICNQEGLGIRNQLSNLYAETPTWSNINFRNWMMCICIKCSYYVRMHMGYNVPNSM